MYIVFSGFRGTPKWETLQTAIREASGDPAATLVRIAKVPGTGDRVNYRATGVYDLGVRMGDGIYEPCNFTVDTGDAAPAGWDRIEVS